MTLSLKSMKVELDAATSVATLTFQRPEKLNALTFETYAELRDAFRALGTEPGVRAVLLTGTGKGFCSGGDFDLIIAELLKMPYEKLLEFSRMTCDAVKAIRECRRPVVAAVNGTTAGAGAVIAAACDLRIASETAKIAFLFTRVGLSGADMGACWLLSRLVGLGRATELLMTGDFLDAAEAHRIGLYNRVVPPDRVLPEARALAEKLARGPSLALEITKDALNREASQDYASALEEEARVQSALMLHPNFREAYQAFSAKREPKFQ